MDFDAFDWDAGNWPKCGKHGLTQEEIEAIFYDSAFEFTPDLEHSRTEQRWIGIGRSSLNSRWSLVVFVIRDRSERRSIRPVSARYMHQKEIRRYVR